MRESDLGYLLALIAAWMILGLLGLLRLHSIRVVARLLFPLGAIVCVGVAVRAGLFLVNAHAPVIAVGDCGGCGGIFGKSYAVRAAIAEIIPVNSDVTGCPPSPAVILSTILKTARSV